VTQAHRLALLVAYDGSAFHGFQRQAGFSTIQSELEDAWTAVTAEQAVMMGSGRTDSGVHAMGQVVHFDTWSRLAPTRVAKALNSYLPDEIVVRSATTVAPEFHANRSATGKRYLYFIQVSETRPVWAIGRATWERRRKLNIEAMREAARHLIGRHNFAAFAAAGRSTQSDVRTIRALHISRHRFGIVLSFEGDGFLYKMVRNIVGSLLEVGRERWGPSWIRGVLEGQDRKRAAPTAPPDGLYLGRVLYPDAIFCESRGRFSGESLTKLDPEAVRDRIERLS